MSARDRLLLELAHRRACEKGRELNHRVTILGARADTAANRRAYAEAVAARDAKRAEITKLAEALASMPRER